MAAKSDGMQIRSSEVMSTFIFFVSVIWDKFFKRFLTGRFCSHRIVSLSMLHNDVVLGHWVLIQLSGKYRSAARNERQNLFNFVRADESVLLEPGVLSDSDKLIR